MSERTHLHWRMDHLPGLVSDTCAVNRYLSNVSSSSFALSNLFEMNESSFILYCKIQVASCSLLESCILCTGDEVSLALTRRRGLMRRDA